MRKVVLADPALLIPEVWPVLSLLGCLQSSSESRDRTLGLLPDPAAPSSPTSEVHNIKAPMWHLVTLKAEVRGRPALSVEWWRQSSSQVRSHGLSMPSDYQTDTCSSADRNKTNWPLLVLPFLFPFSSTSRPPSLLSVQLLAWLLFPVAEENSLSVLHSLVWARYSRKWTWWSLPLLLSSHCSSFLSLVPSSTPPTSLCPLLHCDSVIPSLLAVCACVWCVW